jgi:hypothetical protein
LDASGFRLQGPNAEPVQNRSEVSCLTVYAQRQHPGQNPIVQMLGLQSQWVIAQSHDRDAKNRRFI